MFAKIVEVAEMSGNNTKIIAHAYQGDDTTSETRWELNLGKNETVRLMEALDFRSKADFVGYDVWCHGVQGMQLLIELKGKKKDLDIELISSIIGEVTSISLNGEKVVMNISDGVKAVYVEIPYTKMCMDIMRKFACEHPMALHRKNAYYFPDKDRFYLGFQMK